MGPRYYTVLGAAFGLVSIWQVAERDYIWAGISFLVGIWFVLQARKLWNSNRA